MLDSNIYAHYVHFYYYKYSYWRSVIPYIIHCGDIFTLIVSFWYFGC